MNHHIHIRATEQDKANEAALADAAGVDKSTAVREAIAFALRYALLFKLWLRRRQ